MKREKAFRTTAPHIHSGNGNPADNGGFINVRRERPPVEQTPEIP